MHGIDGTRRWRRGTGVATLGLASILLMAGCGTTTPSASTAPDGAATCVNAATLKTAVANLAAIDLATVGNDDLKSAIDGVNAATDQLIKTAQPDIAQDLEDLSGAVDVAEAAYEEASTSSIAASAVVIKAAIADVVASAGVVEVDLKPSCP